MVFADTTDLTAADLTNCKTHDANYNQRNLEDLLRALRAGRAALVEKMSRADGEVLRRAARHPRLGTPMRLIDHAVFVAEHDDHHLAAMSALLS